MNSAFFASVRPSLFGGSLSQAQVNGINAIEKAWTIYGDGDRRKLAYILATAYHETARTLQPARETLASTDAKAKELLTKAWKAGRMPQVKSDYWSGGYFGRGFVQLTHLANYQKVQDETGHPLVKNPSLALDTEIAALILVKGMMRGWFTGKKLADYIAFTDMRRVVNGTDRAQQIAQYAETFLAALPVTVKPAPTKPIPTASKPIESVPAAPPPKRGNPAGIIAVIVILAALAAAFFFVRF